MDIEWMVGSGFYSHVEPKPESRYLPVFGERKKGKKID
jgi:hypothetical protein